MTGEGLDDKDIVISKLLRQDIQKYKSLFPHVSAAVQSRRNPLKGDTVQYIYTDSKHNNPLCRVTPIENIRSIPQYDKEKYKEMILDAAETVLGFFGFDRYIPTAISRMEEGNGKEMILDAAETVLGFFGFDRSTYSNIKKGRREWRWYEELRDQKARDIETEML